MKMSFKVLCISSLLIFTTACQNTLDTSSRQAKEQSIKQMMTGVYPLNQKIFKQALKTIYANDIKINPDLSKDEVMALTDKRLKGKTIEEILYISFLSKKEIRALPKQQEAPDKTIVANNLNQSNNFIKSNLNTQ